MSTASNGIKTGIFTLFVPAIVGVGVPQAIVEQDHIGSSRLIVARLAGRLLFGLGVIGYFWCAALFVRAQGTPAPLFPPRSTVESGPYRVNRNPMYCAVLAAVFGQALAWPLA